MSDPMLIPSIISGGMSALGNIGQGIMNYFGQDKNREMQIQLANTAYQRQMSDLQKAGINPLMAGRLGGAQTPTLQAPQMTGIPQAADALAPAAIKGTSQILQQQQMTIQKTEAETRRLEAEKEKAIADAALTNTQNSWFGKSAGSAIDLQGAQAEEAKARAITTRTLLEPQVQQILAEATLKSQQHKTEIERTKEAQQAASNAAKRYGSEANLAFTMAEQAAAEFAQFWEKKNKQQVDKNDLEIQLLNTENFHKLIELVLRNKYGDSQEYTKIFSTPWQLPSAFSKQLESSLNDNRVIQKDFSKGEPHRFERNLR